jgi:hypothetical protein
MQPVPDFRILGLYGSTKPSILLDTVWDGSFFDSGIGSSTPPTSRSVLTAACNRIVSVM